jgi:hypothetical protein
MAMRIHICGFLEHTSGPGRFDLPQTDNRRAPSLPVDQYFFGLLDLRQAVGASA